MKKYLILFLLYFFYLILSPQSYSKNYAILISGGYGVTDIPSGVYPCYWYDLVLAYEYLIEEAGYNHDDIYVFFGDGENWDSTSVNNNRYKLSVRYPDWPDIVDFPNILDTVETEIGNFADNIITNKDNLLIWLPRGHGAGDDDDLDEDDYAAWIYQKPPLDYWFFSEGIQSDVIYTIFYNILKFEDGNGNKKYKRKKIIWSTCRSGHVIAGDKTLLNGGDPNADDDDKTIVLTAVDWNQDGFLICINNQDNQVDNEWHSGFTYAIFCTLMEENPWGGSVCDNFEPDINEDGVISMAELFNAIKRDSEYFEDFSWSDTPGYNGEPRYPQKADDPCPMADYLYIDEVLKLENATLELMAGEDKRYYRVDKITAGNNLTIPIFQKIEFVVDTEVRFKPGFHAHKGSRLRARVGGIECP